MAARPIGVAVEAGSAGSEVAVAMSGAVDAFSRLVPGCRSLLSFSISFRIATLNFPRHIPVTSAHQIPACLPAYLPCRPCCHARGGARFALLTHVLRLVATPDAGAMLFGLRMRGGSYLVQPDGSLECSRSSYPPPQPEAHGQSSWHAAGLPHAAGGHLERYANMDMPLSHTMGLAVSERVLLLVPPLPAS